MSTESPRRVEKGKGSAWAQSHVSAGTDPRALRSQRGLCQRAQGARPPNQESTRGDAGTHCPSLWGCECYCTKTAWLLKLGDVSLRCHVYVVFNLSYPGSRMTPWWKGLMRTLLEFSHPLVESEWVAGSVFSFTVFFCERIFNS